MPQEITYYVTTIIYSIIVCRYHIIAITIDYRRFRALEYIIVYRSILQLTIAC